MTDFDPQYRITVALPDGRWQMTNCLQSLQSGLTTALAVGGLDMTLADPTGLIGQTLGRAVNGLPVCLMAPIIIECLNVWDEWGTAWYGYITSAGPAFSGQQGFLFKVTAGDALKLFEVQTQSAADVSALTIASLSNVSASDVLTIAAKSIGLPASQLDIDVLADAGSGIQTSIPPTVFISPQQASWLAVLNGVAQFTGNILFADETGIIHYRPIDYQALPPRSIPSAVVVESHLASSDEEVTTLVEVRFGLLPIASAAPTARESTGAWAAQLKERKYITYMPWLLTPKAAQWAATTLLLQGMAQLGVGQVTILGDHAYHVGDTVRLDYAGKDAFIQSVTQQWQWGGQWLTTLGLTFVRDAGAMLPTTVVPGPSGFPQITGADALSLPALQAQEIALNGASSPIDLTLIATGNKALIPTGANVAGPATMYTSGSLIILKDATTSGAPQLGNPALPAQPIIGTSTTVAQGTLLVYDPAHAGQTEQVVAITMKVPQAQDGTSTTHGTTGPVPPDAPPTPAQQAVANLRNPPAGSPSTPGRYLPGPATPYWVNQVLSKGASIISQNPSYGGAGYSLVPGHLAFTCVGFIVAIFRLSGYADHMDTTSKYRGTTWDQINGTSQNYDLSVVYELPGNQPVAFDQIQPGDLLFYKNTDGDFAVGVEGFSHVAIAYGPYIGPATRYNASGPGAAYTLDTQFAMMGAQNTSQGVTYDTFDDGPNGYWRSHFSAAVRPDWTP